MSFSIGDFISFNKYDKIINIRNNYGVIVNIINEKNKYRYLISIPEYNGDYMWLNYNDLKKINIPIENKISIISNFGEWWYGFHKMIYQNILIDAIKN